MASVIRGSDGFDSSDNATQTELDAIESYTDADALALFNASGSAPVYACRAWVNFNGTGTVAIRESGNVSSITDNGTGDFTINFATAMPDANYVMNGNTERYTSGWYAYSIVTNPDYPQTSSSIRIAGVYGSALYDCQRYYISILR